MQHNQLQEYDCNGHVILWIWPDFSLNFLPAYDAVLLYFVIYPQANNLSQEWPAESCLHHQVVAKRWLIQTLAHDTPSKLKMLQFQMRGSVKIGMNLRKGEIEKELSNRFITSAWGLSENLLNNWYKGSKHLTHNNSKNSLLTPPQSKPVWKTSNTRTYTPYMYIKMHDIHVCTCTCTHTVPSSPWNSI